MIKILTGHSTVGGSTIALSNLCNLFNKNDLNCELYGPDSWVKTKLETDCYKPIRSFLPNKDDIIIYHFIGLKKRPLCKKLILSCHETNIFPVKNLKFYDVIHYVSNYQMNWHKIPGVVIPNVIKKYKSSPKRTENKVAGIIGSIDPNKRVDLSIQRALKNSLVSKVEIWGKVTNDMYFFEKICPLLGERVSYHGVSEDMQKVYDRLDLVYSSSISECLPTVQAECYLAGIEFYGVPQSSRDLNDYIFDDQEILNKWKELLF